MNYKESARKLNEFNDFMEYTKVKLLCKTILNHTFECHESLQGIELAIVLMKHNLLNILK